jgi:hypothetical protein
MQIPEPQAEHLWLHQLIGEWIVESECLMGPDQPPMKTTGTEAVRQWGHFWVICEGTGKSPDGGSWDSIMTLGYDPQSKRYVGTYVASVMTHLWPYLGTLDASANILTLDSEGPSFAGDGTMSKYQDIIEFITPDHRTLTSRMQSEDGTWHQFMCAHYRRK